MLIFGNLAQFCSAIWRKFVRQFGGGLFGNLALILQAAYRHHVNSIVLSAVSVISGSC